MTVGSRVSWTLAGIVLFVSVAELICQLLPVSSSTLTGYYTDPLILTYPARHRWHVATGWDLRNPQTLVSNNEGYAASRDFIRDFAAVALIGDSYVEASMLPAEGRPAAQLEAALTNRLGYERPVYAMGVPGTALLDYAERIRYAHEHYGVHDFVVLMERGDVRQSLCGSGNSNGPCLDRNTLEPRNETLSPPSAAKRALRRSAFAQYLFSQLKVAPEDWVRQLFHRAQSGPAALAASSSLASDGREEHVVDVVTRTFFQRIQRHATGRLVIVMDSDRGALRARRPPAAEALRMRFIAQARTYGAIVVDTAPLFAAHVAASPLSLDVSPHDGHLNSAGIGLVSQAAALALAGSGP